MYTSCGWFFDEISGIETVQVIQYAARVIQLASDLTNEKLEEGFLEILEKAKSNIGENQDGRRVYERFAKPAVMTRETVAAHYAISSLFDSYPEEATTYSFTIKQEDRQLFTAGQAKLAVGRIRVTFNVTRASDVLSYAALYTGEHNATCGVRFYDGPEPYGAMMAEVRPAFERADFANLIRIMDRHFGQASYSLKNLFRDEQRKVLNQILTATREEIHNTYRLLTDRYAPLSRFLADIHAPRLSALEPAMAFVLNTELRKQFDNGQLDLERVKSLLAECKANNVALNSPDLTYAVKKHLDHLQKLSDSVGRSRLLPVEVNLWLPQNVYYSLASSLLPEMRSRTDDKALAWVEKFSALGEKLGFSPNLNPVEA